MKGFSNRSFYMAYSIRLVEVKYDKLIAFEGFRHRGVKAPSYPDSYRDPPRGGLRRVITGMKFSPLPPPPKGEALEQSLLI
jgi:hypothetical protein